MKARTRKFRACRASPRIRPEPLAVAMAVAAEPPPAAPRRGSRAARVSIVLLGIALGQAVLYGPSLIGSKILLPLDLLADPGVLLPRTPQTANVIPHDIILSDLVLFYEPERQFAHAELAAGRFPLWTPSRYAGAPCFRLSFSPAWLLAYAISSPVVLAWTQALIAITAGLGAYAFFRRVLKLSFWPAALAAWFYPLTGAFVIWVGYWQPATMCWLPWMLLATDSAVRRPRGWGGPGLAAVTALALVSGAADSAGQMLLASGIYAIWCCIDSHGLRRISRPLLASIGTTGLAWALGILASAWLLMPMAEYVGTGVRAAERSHGKEERPPVGIAALLPVVLPEWDGSTHRGHFRIAPGNTQESSAGAYAGLIAALVLAPIAWCSRRHRSILVLLTVLGLFSLGWQLNVPGIVDLLRLGGLNLMSHNRFVFVTGFALLAMAAIGLEALWNGAVPRRMWLVVPALLLAGLCGWSIARAAHLPEPLASRLGEQVSGGKVFGSIRSPADVATVQQNYARALLVGAGICVLGIAALARLALAGPPRAWFPVALALLTIGELLWFAHGRAAQCDPALYYPRVAILDQIARSTPGRIIGFNCLPANLAQTHGLRDVRGYDGVDSARLMDLLKPTASPGSTILPYAITQWLTPVVNVPPGGGCRLAPVLDMLGVRYVICRGAPPAGIKPDLAADDYWAMVNAGALPRVWVPQRVEMVRDDGDRLKRLLSPDFDPRRVACVEEAVDLPPECRGSANLIVEGPRRLTVSVAMETAGLVVLGDNWDRGWVARLNGSPVPILRANHALRGVVVPRGRGMLEFRYEPGSLRWGAWISLVAVFAWMGWVGTSIRAMRGHARSDPLVRAPRSAGPGRSKPARGDERINRGEPDG